MWKINSGIKILALYRKLVCYSNLYLKLLIYENRDYIKLKIM